MMWVDFLGLYISTIIVIMSVIFIYKAITKKAFNIDFFTIMIILISPIMLYLKDIYLVPALKAIFSYVMMVMIIGLIFKEDIKMVMTRYMAIWLLVMFYDIVIALTLSMLGIINTELDTHSIIIIKIAITLAEAIAVYFTVKIVAVKKIITKTVNFIYKNYGDYFVLGMLILIVGLLAGYSGVGINDSGTNLIVMIIFTLIAILIIYFIRFKDKEMNLELKNKALENSNNVYNKILEEYEIFKHNKNNQLLALRALTNKKGKEIIDSMFIDKKSSESYFLPIFKNAPIGIKDILFVKFSTIKIEDLKISFSSECDEDVTKKLSTKNYGVFLEAIGIIVDNAIEAVKECESKVIYITIEVRGKELVFSIINTFKSNIDIDSIGKKHYTSKCKGNGIGIFSIKRNKIIKYINSVMNDKFKTEIKVHLKN